MPIVRISGLGLAMIAVSVALLWGCLIGERSFEQRAFAERTRVMREVELLQQKQRPQPVSAPIPGTPHRTRVKLG